MFHHFGYRNFQYKTTVVIQNLSLHNVILLLLMGTVYNAQYVGCKVVQSQ